MTSSSPSSSSSSPSSSKSAETLEDVLNQRAKEKGFDSLKEFLEHSKLNNHIEGDENGFHVVSKKKSSSSPSSSSATSDGNQSISSADVRKYVDTVITTAVKSKSTSVVEWVQGLKTLNADHCMVCQRKIASSLKEVCGCTVCGMIVFCSPSCFGKHQDDAKPAITNYIKTRKPDSDVNCKDMYWNLYRHLHTEGKCEQMMVQFMHILQKLNKPFEVVDELLLKEKSYLDFQQTVDCSFRRMWVLDVPEIQDIFNLVKMFSNPRLFFQRYLLLPFMQKKGNDSSMGDEDGPSHYESLMQDFDNEHKRTSGVESDNQWSRLVCVFLTVQHHFCPSTLIVMTKKYEACTVETFLRPTKRKLCFICNKNYGASEHQHQEGMCLDCGNSDHNRVNVQDGSLVFKTCTHCGFSVHCDECEKKNVHSDICGYLKNKLMESMPFTLLMEHSTIPDIFAGRITAMHNAEFEKQKKPNDIQHSHLSSLLQQTMNNQIEESEREKQEEEEEIQN